MPYKRLILINWKWREIPTNFVIGQNQECPEEDVDLFINSFPDKLAWDHIYDEENDTISQEDAILRLSVDLSSMKYVAGDLAAQKIRLRSFLLDRLQKEAEKIIFFSHRSWLHEETHSKPEVNRPGWIFYQFSTGLDKIYGSLLGTQGPKFAKASIIQTDNQKYVRKKAFDLVWDKYWYRLEAKLRYFLEKIEEASIDSEKRGIVKNRVKNFLNFYQNPLNQYDMDLDFDTYIQHISKYSKIGNNQDLETMQIDNQISISEYLESHNITVGKDFINNLKVLEEKPTEVDFQRAMKSLEELLIKLKKP